MNNLYEQILENDLNPFITFNSNGKLNKFNKEAEFLFNFVSIKELYELAISNATQSFGFQHKYISIKYQKQSFYALLVGYINDDEIVLRLYKEVIATKVVDINNNYSVANIFSLIALGKNSILCSVKNIDEVYDVSIPHFKILINDFLLCLNNIFENIKNEEFIRLKVFLKIGEYEIINNKKYPLVCLSIYCLNNIKYTPCSINTINIFHDKNKIDIDLPIIV